VKILVTGGTGFIGSHTARALAAAGHELRLLVRDPTKAARVLAPHGVDTSDCAVGDVTDATAVAKALDGCEGVFHAAAVVALAPRHAPEVLRTNTRAVELVVGGARERGLRSIVYVSSLSALFHPDAPPITADAPLPAATGVYSRSKTEGERFVRQLQAEGAPVRSTYPPAVLGPDDPGLSEGNRAIQIMVRNGMALTSTGFQILDVRDLAALHVALLTRDDAPGRAVAAGHYFAWRDLADLLDALTGTRIRRVSIPGAVLRLFGRVGDAVKHVYPFDFPLTAEAMDFATRWPGAETSPAVAALGIRWRPARETLADTLRWLQRAGHLSRERVGRLASD
jgi:nucleoside-diphosphate-sugar epimerase